MQAYLLKLDYWLFDLINQRGSFDLGDIFFPWVTDLAHSIYFKVIVVPLLLAIFIKFYKRAGITIFIFFLLAVSFSDFTGSVVKNQTLRLRPFENSEIVSLQKSPAGGKSFYSNHASNMFTFAVYTGQFIPVLKAPTLVIATMIGYSRIYNGVHYPSDVFAGGLFGSLWGYLFSLLAKSIIAKIRKQKEAP